MKNFMCFMVIFLMIAIFRGYGQDNMVKANVTNYLLGDINLEVERKVTQKGSLQIKIGWLDPTKSILFSEALFTPDNYIITETKGGISSSLEFRFYFSGKEGLSGFYAAPYIRYLNQQMVYKDDLEGNEFAVNARVNSMGAGAQLGYQWIINNLFTVDLFFLGIGADKYNGEIKYELGSFKPDYDYSRITERIDDVLNDIEF